MASLQPTNSLNIPDFEALYVKATMGDSHKVRKEAERELIAAILLDFHALKGGESGRVRDLGHCIDILRNNPDTPLRDRLYALAQKVDSLKLSFASLEKGPAAAPSALQFVMQQAAVQFVPSQPATPPAGTPDPDAQAALSQEEPKESKEGEPAAADAGAQAEEAAPAERSWGYGRIYRMYQAVQSGASLVVKTVGESRVGQAVSQITETRVVQGTMGAVAPTVSAAAAWVGETRVVSGVVGYVTEPVYDKELLNEAGASSVEQLKASPE